MYRARRSTGGMRLAEQVCQRELPLRKFFLLLSVITCFGTEVISLRNGESKEGNGSTTVSFLLSQMKNQRGLIDERPPDSSRRNREPGGFMAPQMYVVKANSLVSAAPATISSVPVQVLLVQTPS